MTRQDGMLRWTADKEVGNVWRAWATKLDPTDRLPPYYRISKIARNQAIRRIHLCKPRATDRDGNHVIDIGLASNLAEAKLQAQADYEKRQVSEHLSRG